MISQRVYPDFAFAAKRLAGAYGELRTLDQLKHNERDCTERAIT